MNRKALAALCGTLALAAGCVGADEGAPTATLQETQDNLYAQTTTLWPIISPWQQPTASVCWEQSAGFDSEKTWMRDAITKTWEAESQLRFLSFGNCGAGVKGIRVLFQDAGGSRPGSARESTASRTE